MRGGYFGGTLQLISEESVPGPHLIIVNYKALEQFITWYRESVLLVAIEDPHALITRDHHHDSRTNSQVQGEMICTSQAMT